MNYPCGHPKTTQNTYRYGPSLYGNGHVRAAREMCRTCMSARSKARYIPKPKREEKPRKWKPCLLARVW